MSNETIAETMERSEKGTPVPAEQHSHFNSGVTGAATLIEVIAARRKHLQDEAECAYCGTTLTDCKAERGKDPTAPPWFGCCAHGMGMEPCSHSVSSAALSDLLDEIASGHVRTVEEMLADRRPATERDYFAQKTWWRNRAGEFIKVSEMSQGHRYNSAAMLMRNNPDAREVLRVTALYRALVDGLTIQGDGTEPWQKAGRDPVTGEPCEVPPPMVRVCEIPDCGCSGEAHA